ncbi:MAG: SIS domain-containing protein [Acidimicrobiales bacterium]
MSDPLDSLYPFLAGTAMDTDTLLDDLAASARSKAVASMLLRRDALTALDSEIRVVATEMAKRLRRQAHFFSFGNGGSSSDAVNLAALFNRPPWGVPLPARCLVDDVAVLTAVSNDVGFELAFARQIIAHGKPGDIALAVSTSGDSRNLLTALREAATRQMLTIGLVGYQGGALAAASIDHCLIVRSHSVHRIQETQAAVGFKLWSAVQDELASGDSGA